LLKLIKTNPNGEKTYYNVNADIDEKKVEITLEIQKGILGQRKNTKVTHVIKSKDIKLSSKKGINTIEKFAKEMGNKIYVKKKKEGYDYYDEEKYNKVNEQNISNDNNIINENNSISSNITVTNNLLTNEEINNSLNNAGKIDLSDPQHQITLLSPNKMIRPIFPVEHKFYEPMLAHPYEKRKKGIIFPCFVQPKLDGVRCITVDTDLYSRNGNKFPTLSHIKEELALNFEKLLLDGELYTDDINFEKIVGLVKKGKKTEEEEKKSLTIYLNVFDYIEPSLTFEQRLSNLHYYFKQTNFKHIRLVKTEKCLSEQEIYSYL